MFLSDSEELKTSASEKAGRLEALEKEKASLSEELASSRKDGSSQGKKVPHSSSPATTHISTHSQVNNTAENTSLLASFTLHRM